MSTNYCAFPKMSDAEILIQAKRLAEHERHTTVALVASLMEIDARKLYLAEGYSSLFVFCMKVLRLSEAATCTRTTAARAARKFPDILDRLADGVITLTTVRLLAPHLTEDNWRSVLKEAEFKGKRAVQKIVARISPQPDVKAILRKLPTPRREVTSNEPAMANEQAPARSSTCRDRADADDGQRREQPVGEGGSLFSDQEVNQAAAAAELPKRPSVLVPLSPDRYKLQMTISAETHEKLVRVQELIRHSVPDGDPAAIFDRALTLLLKELERTQLAKVGKPRKDARPASEEPQARSRHIPAAVKRAVVERDGGQCSYVGRGGERCTERNYLQFHHAVPFAVGGPPTVGNVFQRCAAHNRHEATEYFGRHATDWRAQVRRKDKTGTGSGTG